jgi:DnaK suppressor protein
MLSDAETDELIADLRRRLDELGEIDAATVESRRPVELDQQSVGRLSRMDAMQQQAMAQAVRHRREVERKRLRAALSRVDSGEYGYCTRCGAAIPVARLRLDPATPVCVSCAGGAD